MTIPDIKTFNQLGDLMIQRYERYLPTAFDDSLSMLEKVNKVIEYVNQTGRITNELIEFVEMFSGGVKETIEEFILQFGGHLEQQVIDTLEDWQTTGKLDVVISTALQTQIDDLEVYVDDEFTNVNTRVDQTIKVANIEHFGAIGDGVTDNTIAIQNAIDSLVNGGTVYVPPKIYKTSKLKITRSNIKIIGEGTTSQLLATNLTDRFIEVDQGGISGTTSYGGSLRNIQLENLYLKADFEQTLDNVNNPSTWYPYTAVYLNGARNGSVLRNVMIEGFELGVHALFNWMCNYDTVIFQLCKNGMFLDQECNNSTVINCAFRRCGDKRDYSGFGFKSYYSYAITLITNDLERCNCEGFVYDSSHSVAHIGGDIENNDNEIRKVVLRGGTDYISNSNKLTRAISLIGLRFRNSLGIQIYTGVNNVFISGCSFSGGTIPQNPGASAIGVAGDDIYNIKIDNTNDIYGVKDAKPSVSYRNLSTDMISDLRSSYHFVEGYIADASESKGHIIGYLPQRCEITKVQLFSDGEQTPGSCDINIGVGANIGTVKVAQPYNAVVDVSTSPYGITEVTDFTVNQNAGVVRAQPLNATMTGKIGVRIYYKLTW